jgi:hypothetical protein
MYTEAERIIEDYNALDEKLGKLPKASKDEMIAFKGMTGDEILSGLDDGSLDPNKAYSGNGDSIILLMMKNKFEYWIMPVHTAKAIKNHDFDFNAVNSQGVTAFSWLLSEFSRFNPMLLKVMLEKQNPDPDTYYKRTKMTLLASLLNAGGPLGNKHIIVEAGSEPVAPVIFTLINSGADVNYTYSGERNILDQLSYLWLGHEKFAREVFDAVAPELSKKTIESFTARAKGNDGKQILGWIDEL